MRRPMLAELNRDAFRVLSAGPDLGGPSILALYGLARWSAYLVLPVLTLLWVFGRPEEREAAMAAALAGLLALLVTTALARLVDHPLPQMSDTVRLAADPVPGERVPGDHAAAVFGAALALAVRRIRARTWLVLPLLAAGIAIGWARVTLGLTDPAGLLGSLAVAAAMAGLLSVRPGESLVRGLTRLAERLYGEAGSIHTHHSGQG